MHRVRATGRRPVGSRRVERGFTLIEMLIVIAIIALIAAAALPAINNVLDQGRMTTTERNIQTIASAIEQYNIKYASYPKIGDLGNLEQVDIRLAPLIEREGFMQNVPREDAWGHPILYGSDGVDFTLRSYAKNGQLDNAVGGNPSDPNADVIWINSGWAQMPKL